MALTKNPISLLQETCTQMGRLPIYDFQEVKMQEFRCTVKVCDFMTEAIAKGKKLAKTIAAEKMLQELGVQSSTSSEHNPQHSLSNSSNGILTCSTQSDGISRKRTSSPLLAVSNKTTIINNSSSSYSTADESDIGFCLSPPFSNTSSISNDAWDFMDCEQMEVCEHSEDITDNAVAGTSFQVSEKPSAVQTNGTLNPISILEEKMRKQNEVPNYEFVTKAELETSTFFFEVTAAGKTAIGSGTTKKEAKANAALSVLEMLGYEIKRPIVQISPTDNTVGKLQEFCQTNYTNSLPTYDVIKKEGKAHELVFTIRCSIGSNSVEHSAGSKQMAKHLCAKEMLQILEKSRETSLKEIQFNSKLSDQNINVKAWQRIEETGAREKIKLGNDITGVPFKDYVHLFENNYYGTSETLNILKLSEKSEIYILSNPKSVFDSIVNELSLRYDLLKINSKNGVILNLFIKSQPNWSFMASSYTFGEAEKQLFVSALEFLYDM